ncbi:glycosyltransferase family 61 protein [Methylobacterium sp. J-090]|uniref:glycosyltransferase family 61 protein n=1 Tax=Methylobacterium sp. J-090 TaxID=2836666 RepID=UPI001FBA0458|nr:glycosyltransferase family 61 protein [Methylobacterium sp. J-090]MCJ2082581.1 glycosyltransferase family 61 protein [Methylobacterium sp. J-090]
MTPRLSGKGIRAAWASVARRVRRAFAAGPDRRDRRAGDGAGHPTAGEIADAAADATDAPPPVAPLQLRALAEILREAGTGPAAIETLVAYPRVTVHLPPLRVGAETLERVAIRESERHASWRQTSYLSLPTTVHAIADALVHGSAGLLGIGDAMVTETTWHTEPGRHRYRIEDSGIRLEIDRVTPLSGTHLSLLMPGGNSYWHAVIDGVAKLSTVPDTVLKTVRTVLYASDAIGQGELLALAGLPPGIEFRPVLPSETLRVETLLLPWDLHGVFDYHPVLNRFFDAVLANHVVDGRGRIERLYVDRRGASQRRLSNEDAVVHALAALGFVAVRLEDLTIPGQINLFRQARIIVSPHGAGLTNIGFASRGCIVIELMMDAYANWCFRRLAGLRDLTYGCVIGAAPQPWADLNPAFHGQTWEVPVADVVRAVEVALSGQPARGP